MILNTIGFESNELETVQLIIASANINRLLTISNIHIPILWFHISVIPINISIISSLLAAESIYYENGYTRRER